MNDVLEPSDREAERAVLGAMMLSADTVWQVAEHVKPEDFYEPKHESICRVIFGLANNSKPTGAIEVCDGLEKAKLLHGELDRAFVFGLMVDTPSYINAGYWAEIVRDKAIRRRLAAASGQIAGLAATGTVSAEELVEQAREVVDAAADGTKSQVRAIGDAFDAYVNALDEKPRFVTSPWWNLDALIGGFRSGCLYIVGARPAQGKSIVGLQAAVRLAQVGPVAFCSLEMGREEIAARLIAQMGQVHLTPLMNHSLSRMNWNAVAGIRARIKELPIYISDSSEVSTITQVRAFARSVKRKAPEGKPMAGLVVDYTQLLVSGSKSESRQLEVAGFVRSLKLLARDLDIPVIALSQLNRDSAKGGTSKKPGMVELRESGALEQDADVVILLHHDEAKTPNFLDMIVAKNRHGKSGEVRLAWEGQFARVIARPWSPTALIESDGGN